MQIVFWTDERRGKLRLKFDAATLKPRESADITQVTCSVEATFVTCSVNQSIRPTASRSSSVFEITTASRRVFIFFSFRLLLVRKQCLLSVRPAKAACSQERISIKSVGLMFCFKNFTSVELRVQIVHTRSSAIAEGPRDASCQLKSCQLPRNSAETTCTTSLEPSIRCR